MDPDELRTRVRRERRLRGWSERQAAEQSHKNPHVPGISNTTWGKYEKTGNLTDGIRVAISVAFDWPRDWPSQPPDPDATPQAYDRLTALLVEMRERLAALEQRFDALEHPDD